MRKRTRGDTPAFCVCVPARNEAERLPILLRALAAQDIGGTIDIALFVNNSTDQTARAAERTASAYRGRLSIHIQNEDFAPELAHAGSARRGAMDAGAALVGVSGVLISTDADTRPPPDWIAANLGAVNAGAELVGGKLVLDENEPLPPDAQALRALWDRYWHQVRVIEDACDPKPFDPPPRHGDHTGASLAITAASYMRAGRVPLQPTGEDRALVNAALAIGARLRHPIEVWTRVSPRVDGRAAGGMAQAMVALSDAARHGEPMMAPSFEQWRKRAIWRKHVRSRCDAASLLAREDHLLPPIRCDALLPALVAR